MGKKKKSRGVEQRSAYDGPSFSIGDPALAEFFGVSGTDSGVHVNETTALGVTAFYRAIALISGTIAQLPLKTYSTAKDGTRKQVASFLDDPGGDLLTPFEFKELTIVHLLLHGNAFLLHQRNMGGAIISLFPVHPALVQVELAADDQKKFKVTGADGMEMVYGPEEMTQIMGPSLDGVRGMSVLSMERNALGTAIAGDTAAGRLFRNGLLLGGLLSMPGATEQQLTDVLAGVKAKAQGAKHAGDILGLNIEADFKQWTMSAEDAQFLESRQFSVAEVARITGLPVQLLAADGASSWGSGISELIRAMQKFTLVPLSSRLEERLSRLLPSPRKAEFEYRGLLEGTPAEVTANLAAEIAAGLTTLNEARAVLNKPPLAAQAPPPETE